MKLGRGARAAAEVFIVERLTEPSTPLDLSAVEEIARASFSDAGISAREELARTWSRLWVARISGEDGASAGEEAPVGFMIAWHVADELHVLNIATSPPMRRRGVARALMGEALQYSTDSHIRILILEVRRSNRAAIKLYRGLGFTALGVRVAYYADTGEDAIEMMLALDPATGHALPGRDEIHIDG